MYLDCMGNFRVPADVAVVIPTVVRGSIFTTLESVFHQEDIERISVMIGVDVALGNLTELKDFAATAPPHFNFQILSLPYSTSVRHGGVHMAMDGGALRAILSLMANARYVAYLDDDNTWAPDHLSKLYSSIQGKTWAFSQKYLVDEDTGENYGQDIWHSVGVDKGDFASQGGFVDTNCLMVDVVRCAPVIGRWASSGSLQPGFTADRFFFQGIRNSPYGWVVEPTVFYKIRKANVLHRYIRSANV